MTVQLHTLVHLGAGSGSQLPDHLSLNPSRIVLIEPLPSQAQGLRQASANNKNIDVWELAISCSHNNGIAPFTEFNLADASSLHSASGLLDLYPGIKVTQQHQVPTITPAELITRLQLPADSSHRLIIEANGEESAIINALAEHQLLTRFANIELTLARTALYNGEYNPQRLQSLLSNYNFDLIKDNSDEPDTSIFTWQHNPLKQHIAELNQQLAHSQATSVEQQNAAKAQLAEHKLAQEKLSIKLAEQNAQLIQLTRLKKQLTHSQTTSVGQQNAAKAQRAEHKLEQERLNIKLAEQDAQLTQVKKQLAQAQLLNNEQAQQQQQTEQQLIATQEQLANSQAVAAEQKIVAKAQLAEQKSEQEKLNIQLAEQDAQLTQLKKQLVQAQSLNKEQAQQQQQTAQQLIATQEQLANSQAVAAEQQNAVKAQLAEHKSEQEKLNVQLAEQDAQLIQLKKQLAQAQSLNKEQIQQQQQTEQQLKVTQEKLAKTEQALHTTKDELANTTAARLSTEEELSKYKDYFANRKKQHQAAELRITELTQTLAENSQQLVTLKQQLDTQQNSQQTLTALEQKMEQLFNSQAEQLIKNTNALGQHVTKMHNNSQRYLQSTMAVQHSLHHGELPLQFNEANISTELAQYLIEKIQRTNYDLIIEFGSGTSTLLLAKTLSNKIHGTTSLNHVGHTPTIGYQQTNELSEYISPNHHDLPQRIISFEHNKRYHQDTQQHLQQDKLDQLVDLQLAPLIDYQEQENSLFYDCIAKLKQLAQLFNGRDAHILILVDGPSSDQENPLARYPALPCVLNYLSAHRLDLVLDDYHREGEQTVAKQWRALLAKRDLTVSEQQLGYEKDALLLSINQ